MCNSGPEERIRPDPDHFTSVQTTQGEGEKLHEVPTRDSCCSLGHGQLQRISEWFQIHIVQGSNHRNKPEHYPSENDQQTEDCHERTQFRNQGQTEVRFTRFLKEGTKRHTSDTRWQPSEI